MIHCPLQRGKKISKLKLSLLLSSTHEPPRSPTKSIIEAGIFRSVISTAKIPFVLIVLEYYKRGEYRYFKIKSSSKPACQIPTFIGNIRILLSMCHLHHSCTRTALCGLETLTIPKNNRQRVLFEKNRRRRRRSYACVTVSFVCILKIMLLTVACSTRALFEPLHLGDKILIF